jgi:hypothetical protein
MRCVELDKSDGGGAAGVEEVGKPLVLFRAPTGQNEFVDVRARRYTFGEPPTEIAEAYQQNQAAHI